MAKFCGNCGAQFDGSARFCGRCGAPLGGYDAAPKPRQKRIVILVVAIFVIIAAVVGVAQFYSPESMAQRNFKAWAYGRKAIGCPGVYDGRAMMLAPYNNDEDAFFEAASDQYDEEITSWSEFDKASGTAQREKFESAFGKYTVRTKVAKVKDVSAKKARDAIEDTFNRFEMVSDFDRDDIGFDPDAVRAGKTVTLSVVIEGEDDTYHYTIEVQLVQMGLTWRVLGMNITEIAQKVFLPDN